MSSIAEPIVTLIESLVGPALLIVTAVGLLYCILLGVKFAKAEEPQEHEKAKKHLQNAVIGYVLIFILMFALRAGTPLLVDWVNEQSGNITVDDLAIDGTGSTSTTPSTNTAE